MKKAVLCQLALDELKLSASPDDELITSQETLARGRTCDYHKDVHVYDRSIGTLESPLFVVEVPDELFGK